MITQRFHFDNETIAEYILRNAALSHKKENSSYEGIGCLLCEDVKRLPIELYYDDESKEHILKDREYKNSKFAIISEDDIENFSEKFRDELHKFIMSKYDEPFQNEVKQVKKKKRASKEKADNPKNQKQRKINLKIK